MTSAVDRSWWSHLARYCLRHRSLIALLLLAAVAAQVFAVAAPLVVRRAVDELLGRVVHQGVGYWAGLLAVLAIFAYGANVLSLYTGGRLALNVTHQLRTDAFDVLVGLESTDQDRLDTGQVVSRTVADLMLVQGAIAAIPTLAGNVLMVLLIFGAMAVLSPTLTLLAAGMAPALWFLAHRAPPRLFSATWAAQQLAAELTGKAEAAVSGVAVVKGFAQEDRELHELRDESRKLYGARMRVARLQNNYSAALQSVPLFWQGGLLLLGGALALSGRLSIGVFLAFCVYLTMVVGPLRGITPLLTVVQQAGAATDRVMAIITSRPMTSDPAGPVTLPSGPLSVELQDVRFGYGDAAVFTGLSLRIEAGETVAVVGAPGSGKSTLVSLLGLFHRPDAGTVWVGGANTASVRAVDLRARTGFVFEDTFLFDESVRDNVSCGRPGVDPDRIRAVARAVAAETFIEALPEGYDTVVGERGRRLSGGQRQRVALARALLFNPGLLVLDDATSAVDGLTEQRILAELVGAADRTTVLIARRRSTLKFADRVVVLGAGRVVDSGSVADVERRCPAFRAIFTPRAAGALEPPVPSAQPAAADEPEAVAVPAARDTPEIPDSVAFALPARLKLPGLIGPVRFLLGVALVLIFIDIGARTAIPALVRSGVDNGIAGESRSILLLAACAVLVLAATDWLAAWYGTMAAARAGERLLYLMRVRVFAHLQRLGMEFYDRERTGQLLTYLTTDIDALAKFLQLGIPLILVSLATLAAVLTTLFAADVRMALVVIATLPVITLATWLLRVVAIPSYGAARQQVGALNSLMHETISGLRVAQAYGRVGELRARYTEASWRYRGARLRAHLLIGMYMEFIGLLNDLARVGVLLVGSAELARGNLSAGALVAFFLYVDLFFGPVRDLSGVLDQYRQATVSFKRLGTMLRAPVLPPSAPDALPARRPTGDIRMRDVGLTYPGTERPALIGVNLVIRPGETVALVGSTGSGKSSLVKLVARFYDPTTGSITVGSMDLRQIDPVGHRRRLGIVAQEPYLPVGTVREAIAYGQPGASDVEVEDAARAVGAYAVIAGLPGGFGHRIGPRGYGLSAGQRQLIALARAQLIQPDVLLLDEATAVLDPSAETAVLDAMSRLAERRMTLVIAHRLTTAARADRVVVLDAGRVVEAGTHDELLAAGGHYARLWVAHTATGCFAEDEELAGNYPLESTWLTQPS